MLVSSPYSLILSPLLVILLPVLFHPTFGSKSIPGEHVCTRVETYLDNVQVLVEEPIKMKRYQWCVGVPPRCTAFTTELRNRTKIEAVEKNRTVSECCAGFVEINSECVPECPPNQPCPNMKCQDTKHCFCLAGYTGLHCNTTCPVGRWGSNCTSKCQCGETNGNKCHHLTGKCILPTTTPLATTEAPTTPKPTTPSTTTVLTTTPLITTPSTTTPKPTTPITTPPTTRTTLPAQTLPPVITQPPLLKISTAKPPNTGVKLDTALFDLSGVLNQPSLNAFDPFKSTVDPPTTKLNLPPTIPPSGGNTFQFPAILSLPPVIPTEEWPYTLPKLTTARPVLPPFGQDKVGLENFPTPFIPPETTHKSTLDDDLIKVKDVKSINLFPVVTTQRSLDINSIQKKVEPALNAFSTPFTFPTTPHPALNSDITNKNIAVVNAFPSSHPSRALATLPTLPPPLFEVPFIPTTQSTKTKVIDKLNVISTELDKSFKSVVSSVVNKYNASISQLTTTPRNDIYGVVQTLNKTHQNAKGNENFSINNPVMIPDFINPTPPSVKTHHDFVMPDLTPATLSSPVVTTSKHYPIPNLPSLATSRPSIPPFSPVPTSGRSLEQFVPTSAVPHLARDLSPNVNANEFNVPKPKLTDSGPHGYPVPTLTSSIATQATSLNAGHHVPHVTPMSHSHVVPTSHTTITTKSSIPSQITHNFNISVPPKLPNFNELTLPPQVSNFNSPTVPTIQTIKPPFDPSKGHLPTIPTNNPGLTLPPQVSKNSNPTVPPTVQKFNPPVPPPLPNFNPIVTPKSATLPPQVSHNYITSVPPTIQTFKPPVAPPLPNFNPPPQIPKNLNPTPEIFQNFNPSAVSSQPKTTVPPTLPNFNLDMIPQKSSVPQGSNDLNLPVAPTLPNFKPMDSQIPHSVPSPPPTYNAPIHHTTASPFLPPVNAFQNFVSTVPVIPIKQVTIPPPVPSHNRHTPPPESLESFSSEEEEDEEDATLPPRPNRHSVVPPALPESSTIASATPSPPRYGVTAPPRPSTLPTTPPKPVNPDLDKAIGIFENSLNDLMKSMEGFGLKKTGEAGGKSSKPGRVQSEGLRGGAPQNDAPVLRGASSSLFSQVAAISGDDNDYMRDRNYHPTSVGMNLIYIPPDESASDLSHLYKSVSLSSLVLILCLMLTGYVIYRRRRGVPAAGVESAERETFSQVPDPVEIKCTTDRFCKFINPDSMQLLTELQESQYQSPPTPQPIYEEIRW